MEHALKYDSVGVSNFMNESCNIVFLPHAFALILLQARIHHRRVLYIVYNMCG